jgi:prepilin-type N-terminal cleavage/methylation domain-containing protein
MRCRSKGFSLTEMVVVVAILILLAAAILPVIGPMRRQSRLKAGAAEVAGALRAARSMAIARSAACYVYTNTSTDPDEVRLYFAISKDPELVGRLPGSVSLVAPSGEASAGSFQPDGSPSSGFSISVTDGGDDRYRVSVSPGSGQVGIARVKP